MLAWLKKSILIAALISLIYIIIAYQNNFIEFYQNINVTLFIISILLGFLANIILAYVFKCEIQLNNNIIENKKLFHLYFIGQIAKYIPGKIWGIAYQASALQGEATTRTVIKSNYYLTIFSLTSSALLAACTLFFLDHLIIGLTIVTFALANFLYLPKIINKILPQSPQNKLFVILKSVFTNQQQMKTQLIFLMFFTGLNGFTLITFFYAFSNNITQSLHYLASYSIAWIVSVLTIIFPAGAGIREAVFISLSSTNASFTNIESLFAVAVAIRIWQLFVDSLGFILSYLFFFCKK